MGLTLGVYVRRERAERKFMANQRKYIAIVNGSGYLGQFPYQMVRKIRILLGNYVGSSFPKVS